MAICRIIETGATPEQYDQVTDRLGTANSPPPGAQLHVAAVGDDGKIRVIELWDSRDQAQQFSERILATRREVGVAGEPSVTYMDVHNLLKA